MLRAEEERCKAVQETVEALEQCVHPFRLVGATSRNPTYQSLKDASKRTVDIMKELRLTTDYAVVFCRRTPELMRKLILVEPYVAWGHPNLTTIQELLTKHAFTIVYVVIHSDG